MENSIKNSTTTNFAQYGLAYPARRRRISPSFIVRSKPIVSFLSLTRAQASTSSAVTTPMTAPTSNSGFTLTMAAASFLVLELL